ncbi:MAG: PD-(D/E)XK nuclease family protein [Campylobacterota bacterium]|nr:PD-(D/E)XK nuclease family protein [Campylobacterota bacterium]
MLKNSLIILPTSRAIREEILRLKSKNQLLDKYITIGDFFQVAVLDKKNRTFCEKNIKILYLKEAIKNTNLEKLGLSSDFSTFVKQSEYLFRFFIEISNEFVDIKSLLEYDTYSLYSDHIEILQAIYKNYKELLENDGYVDNILLPNSYIINDQYIKQFDTITIYLEGYLSGFEYKVIDDISDITQTNIVFTLNQFNQKNKELFCIDDIYDIDTRYKIDITNNKLISKTKDINQNKKITISPVSSAIEQVSFIKYQITQMIKDGIQAEKIAVIVPNEKIATTLEMFDDEHYFNFAMGRGINKTKLVQTLKHISKMIVDFEPKDDEISKFLELDKLVFENLFKNNWNKVLNKEIFNDIFDYLISLESNKDIIDQIEQIKISFDILFFSSIKNLNEKVLVKEFLKLLQVEISGISIDDVNGGKITVLGILESRLIGFDGVVVIDFNDDKIPKISIKDKFISSKLKSKVALPTIEDRENLQRYYYKRLFSNATNIAISYVDDESMMMSRFVMQIFPEYKKYIEKKDYASILFKSKKLNHFTKDIVENIDLSTLAWSATSLKSYLTCKRQFYFKYIAKISDHTISIKPQNYEIGDIIHNALEKAVKDGDFSYAYVSRYLTSQANKNPYLVLELELWKKKLAKFFEFEDSRISQGIKIDKVELPFDFVYNGIRIRGKIDRIDRYPDNSYEILDYKTSSSLKIDTIKNYEDSKDFQLEFYYLASNDKMIRDVGYYTLGDCKIKNEVVLQEKLKLLDIYFQSLKTKSVDFKQTTDTTACVFCPYKTICQR